jgi:hypothetical protein
MNPIGTALLVGAMVIVGKWAKGLNPNIDNAIGVAGIAVGLSVIEKMDPRLSNAFAILILVGTSAVYLPTIVKAAGLGGKK